MTFESDFIRIRSESILIRLCVALRYFTGRGVGSIHACCHHSAPSLNLTSLQHQLAVKYYCVKRMAVWQHAGQGCLWGCSAYLGLSWLISSHIILFILPAQYYLLDQPNSPFALIWARGIKFSTACLHCDAKGQSSIAASSMV